MSATQEAPVNSIQLQRFEVEPERLQPGGDIAIAFLAGKGAKKTVLSPFSYNENLYVTTELNSSQAKAYLLGEFQEWVASDYEDVKDDFDGEKIRHNRKDYSLIGPPVVFAANGATQGETVQANSATNGHSPAQLIEKPQIEPHPFRPTTAYKGKCSQCKKGRDTPEHKLDSEQKKKRERNGQPKQTATYWLTNGNAALATAAERRKNPFEGKKLTAAKERDWQSKLDSAIDHQRWGETMLVMARDVKDGFLPPALHGLTTNYQVRTLMSCVLEGTDLPGYGMPTNMGPTIKTAEEFKEAVRQINQYVPILQPYTVDGEIGRTTPLALAAEEPPSAAGEATSENVVFVDPARVDYKGDIYSSYVEGLFNGTGTNKVPNPFTQDAELYVCTSMEFTDEGDSHTAWRLIPLSDYEDQTWESYNAKHNDMRASDDPVSYDGVIVKHGKKEYVLAGPAITFKPQPAEVSVGDFESSPVNETTLPDIVTEDSTFSSYLDAPLTTEEYQAKVDHHLELKRQIAELEMEAKDTAKAYKTKLEKLEQDDRDNDEILHTKAERREITCRRRRDYVRGVVETIRDETGDVVESRPMTAKERQRDLFAVATAL